MSRGVERFGTTFLRAPELQPGDVVVLSAGDTRQVHARATLRDGDVHVDWGDGRHSLLAPARVLVLLREGQPPKTPPPVIDSDAISDTDRLGGQA